MEVKLKVLVGGKAGQEIRIPRSPFIIGRGEECHLRPKSDTISRRHCTIFIEESKVTVQDNSKNGTFVNDAKIDGQQELSPNDRLKIGLLEFEVLFSIGMSAAKKPKVKDVRDVAVRTVKANSGEMDVMQWLEDEDQEASFGETTRMLMADTAQFRKEDLQPKDPNAENSSDATVNEKLSRVPVKSKEPGKLPTAPPPAATRDTREAAADSLKKLFRR